MKTVWYGKETMNYILGGIRFKTNPDTETNGKIRVDMIKDKQVVDTFRVPSDLEGRDLISRISVIVLSSYPALSNTMGFKFKS